MPYFFINNKTLVTTNIKINLIILYNTKYYIKNARSQTDGQNISKDVINTEGATPNQTIKTNNTDNINNSRFTISE